MATDDIFNFDLNDMDSDFEADFEVGDSFIHEIPETPFPPLTFDESIRGPFNAAEEAIARIKQFGRSNGFGVVKHHTNRDRDGFLRAYYLVCDRSRKPTPDSGLPQAVRKGSGSKKTDCKFRVQVSFSKTWNP
jgi:hypothetical protein